MLFCCKLYILYSTLHESIKPGMVSHDMVSHDIFQTQVVVSYRPAYISQGEEKTATFILFLEQFNCSWINLFRFFQTRHLPLNSAIAFCFSIGLD